MTYENVILLGNATILIGTLLVGLIVTFNGLSRKMDNLMLLGLLYLLTASTKVIQIVFSLQWAEIAYFQTAVPLLILEFTRRTFYKGRKDARQKTAIFYGLSFLTYALSAWFAFQFTLDFQDRSLYNVAATFDILTVILPNIYTIIAAREALEILNPRIVEKYIFSRIKLWINLTIMFTIAYSLWVLEILYPGDATYAVLNSISTVVGLIYMFGSYLLWVLPSWFKDYLNKGTLVEQPTDVEATDELYEEVEVSEELQGDTLNILGSYLSEYLNSSELASRGHLRYAARKIYPNESIKNLDYRKWKNVLGEYLVDQLSKLNTEMEPEQISTKMQDDLTKTQSVITMAVN